VPAAQGTSKASAVNAAIAADVKGRRRETSNLPP
jgi:hypothetical protein